MTACQLIICVRGQNQPHEIKQIDPLAEPEDEEFDFASGGMEPLAESEDKVSEDKEPESVEARYVSEFSHK